MNWVDNCCTIFFRLGEIDSGILLTQCWGPALISRCNPLIRGYLGKVAHLFGQISASGLHNARPGRHFWKSASCKQDQILCSIIDVSALSRQRPTLTAKSSSCSFMCLDRLNALERRPGPKLLCCSTNLNQAGMIGRFWKSIACAVQWLLSISLSNLISLNLPTISILTWFSSSPFFPGSVILLFVCSVCDLIRRFLSPLQWLRFILRFHLYL